LYGKTAKMKYYEAIANAIMKIELRVNKPVKLECNIRDRSVAIYVLEEGKWRLVENILDFNDVSYLEVEEYILGNLQDEETT
jgi:hypothetical protein